MGGTEPACRAHRIVGHGAGSTLIPDEVRRGYMASSSLCVDDLTAEPPAHVRLLSDHDLCEIVACLDCTPALRLNWCDGGEKKAVLPSVILRGETESDILGGADKLHHARRPRRSRSVAGRPQSGSP
jgi:hypothetical protein